MCSCFPQILICWKFSKVVVGCFSSWSSCFFQFMSTGQPAQEQGLLQGTNHNARSLFCAIHSSLHCTDSKGIMIKYVLLLHVSVTVLMQMTCVLDCGWLVCLIMKLITRQHIYFPSRHRELFFWDHIYSLQKVVSTCLMATYGSCFNFWTRHTDMQLCDNLKSFGGFW